MRLEVRCCCKPTKLLGWLEVPRELVQLGGRVCFETEPRYQWADGYAVQLHRRQTITLPIAMFKTTDVFRVEVDGRHEDFELEWDAHLALKSEEVPLEVLRQIPGFLENIVNESNG